MNSLRSLSFRRLFVIHIDRLPIPLRELPVVLFFRHLFNLFPFVNYSAFQLGNAAGPGP